MAHPQNKIVAFPRFVPDSQGNRKREGIAYKKVYSLSKRYELLEERFPHYLIFDPVFGEQLCEVPKQEIKHYYDPASRLRELCDNNQLDMLETDALRFAEFLQHITGLSWDKLGISGSLLVKLHTSRSDIDPIVYGRKNCLKIYQALKTAMEDGANLVKSYTLEELRTLYDFRLRDTIMSFRDFVAAERRKVLQGKFLHHDFFIRCVKDWNEVEESYGDKVYRKIGYAKIKATISDDSEAIFTPCQYSIVNVKALEGERGETVTEIVSFRGRFCDQARKGETVVAQGKVEEVHEKDEDTFFRLLLGGRPSDFMVLAR
ncbi:MAG: hypothetical protein ACLFU9_04450 [Candidatus Bathyarchaeia archaeon]